MTAHAFLGRPGTTPDRRRRAGGRRVLVYRCGSLGDTLVALPAIHAVRDAFPGAHLTLMTANDGDGVAWADEVLGECGWFDGVVTYRTAELRSLGGLGAVLARVRRARPDLVVYLGSDRNGAGRVWRDRLFFALAGVWRFVPSRTDKATWLGRLRREPCEYPFEVDRLLDGLRRAGIPAGPARFDLPCDPATEARVTAALAGVGARRPLVALCPGSRQASKRWPLERWAAVGAWLIAEGADVALVGAASEAGACARVARGWPAERVARLTGRLGILESAALLRRCRLYAGNDTGAMHLAAAVGTPCVAVFAAREPARSWHPYGPGHVVLRHDEVPCANCYLSECTSEGLRCLDAVTVDEVRAACAPLLGVGLGPAARRGA